MQVIAVLPSGWTPSLQPAEVVCVFDVSLADFLRASTHSHADINYFGTPSFRVHTFECPAVGLVSSPGVAPAPLPVMDALKSGSFKEDTVAPPGSKATPLVNQAMVKGSVALADAVGEPGSKYTVFGLTAAILIQVASVYFNRPPGFATEPEGGKFFAPPPYAAPHASVASAPSKL